MMSYKQSKITLPTTTVGVGCIQSVIQQHHDDDIMCGRGKSHAKNKGNMKFIAMVRLNLERYQSAPKPIDRSIVVASLLSELIESGARFIKQDGNTKEWFVMSDDQAHQKIGHSIRDMIARSKKQESNRSKNKSRLAKKKQLQQKMLHKNIICFEPICHRSSHFINHDITRAFSMKSSDLLASALAVQQFSFEDNKQDEQQNDIHNIITDIIQPPELARYCSEESIETYIPQIRSRSIISLSFFDSILYSEDNKDVLHDLTGEIFCLDFPF
ncbi:hypothetical protein FRACYDRAFT_246389 [Fragilariopsis cylindrus CCMP1102]|uniref:DUF6824 domain-containing protein n=1 Tax=Fragilariopsis cylindrus CCMP1102 TaxID=635003 RepID=A0A1E7EZJ8_9STRA|nr:hypothetical protein FRACYDRAFT_246389 [Fragilariopsis cylindrus CCMP1102]|eukprot:OEU11276.1 hypothetical protein FRACYDRAFT_246389 [Fragilariopsis cylindrus CCMP1102]